MEEVNQMELNRIAVQEKEGEIPDEDFVPQDLADFGGDDKDEQLIVDGDGVSIPPVFAALAAPVAPARLLVAFLMFPKWLLLL